MQNLKILNERLLCLVLLVCFGILVALGIHGYSISLWHTFIDSSPADELLFGHPQGIRSDDWGLDLPIALSQVTHNPKFPVINENIGLGANILSPIKVPSLSPITFFRPSVWGYFLGGDQGMAWAWWYMVFGLFYSCYLLFKIISRGEQSLSFFAAIAVALSPYFRIWAYHKSEIFIGMAFTFVCFVKLLEQKETKKILLWGALMGWFAGCMVFNFMYPPILVPAGLLLLSLFLGHALNLRMVQASPNPSVKPDTPKSLKFGFTFSFNLKNLKQCPLWGFALASVIFGLSIFFIVIDSWDSIQAILNTTYPGRRLSTGGGVPAWTLFADHFFLRFAAPEAGGWGPLGNECETASFFIFFPMILPFYYVRFYRERNSIDWLVLSLSLYLLLVLSFQWIGLPLWLSQMTFLAQSIPTRVFGGIGLASFILTVKFFADFKQGKLKDLEYRKFVIVGSLVLLIAQIIGLTSELPNFPNQYLTIGVITQILLMALLFYPKFGLKWFFAAQCLVLLFYTNDFNPIVRGGYEYILGNPLTKKIQAIHANAPPGSKWLVTGAVPKPYFMILDNYMRMIGVPTIGSYQCPPQPAIWREFNLTPKELNITNQCAFSYFQSADVPWRIVPHENGVYSVYGRPGDAVLDKLNVRFYLVEGQPKEFDVFFNNSKFRLLDSFQHRRIYERINN
jgi:hypothetical protein